MNSCAKLPVGDTYPLFLLHPFTLDAHTHASHWATGKAGNGKWETGTRWEFAHKAAWADANQELSVIVFTNRTKDDQV